MVSGSEDTTLGEGVSNLTLNASEVPKLFNVDGLEKKDIAKILEVSNKRNTANNVDISKPELSVYPEKLLKDIEDNKGYAFKPDISKDPMLTETEEDDAFIPWPPKPEYQQCIDFYKRQQAAYWTMEEVPLEKDREDFKNKLSEDGRSFILSVLGFFVSSDTIVMENLAVNFMREVKRFEPKQFFGFQICIEGIHSETYVMLVNTLVDSTEEMVSRVASIRNSPVIKNKDKWAIRWINDKDTTFAERLVAFIVVEGIFFSASFCAIGWLSTMNIMKGLSYANEKISADEGLHCKHLIALFKMLKETPPKWRVQQIVASGIEVELEYVKGSLPVDLLGMNSRLMCQYVMFVGDVILQHLGCEPLYNVKNPFDWMINWAIDGHTAFFENRVAAYQTLGVMPSSNKKVSPSRSPIKINFAIL